MNLTINEIAAACGGHLIATGTTSATVTSVSTDTRNMAAGALYVPIVGVNFNGHNYIAIAASQGAVCALTEDASLQHDIPLIYVQSTRRALMQLAGYYRRLFDIKVVAVTGSAGKTTTKDMIYHVLARKYRVKKTLGNFNNDIGMPLSIFQLCEGDQVLVLEMGMNHAAEIHELSLVGAPDIAVITHIGDAHIENFVNREGILHAKLEIVDGLKAGGTVILNGNDPLLTGEIAAQKTALFEVLFPSSSNIIEITNSTLLETSAHVHWQGHDINLTVPLPGAHMVMNALLAVAVGIECGVSADEIAKGFEDFIPPGGRLTVSEMGGITVINDAYNANPAAMKESIKILCRQPSRKVAILGDMNELGQVAPQRHAEIGAFAAESGIDLLIAIGEMSRHIYDSFNGLHKLHFATVAEFLQQKECLLLPGDVVLVKASRGMALEQIIDSMGN